MNAGPDIGMRGFTLQGLRGGSSTKPIPSAFFYKQAAQLAEFKMNVCYAAYEDSIATEPERHAAMILGIADHCSELHLQYIPTMSAGAKVGAIDGRTGEGVWARNVSFTVSKDDNTLQPAVAPFVLAEDFEAAALSGWELLDDARGAMD